MQPNNTMTTRCAQCGQPVEAQVRTVVDAQRDPEGKSLLLSNRLNAAQCPSCGNVTQVGAPLLYHDASKELLIAFVPMEVGVQQGQNEEKIVGDLMNQLTSDLDASNFKSYMFNPKRALTLQGVIDQVLEADGITKEMVEAQRKRVSMVQDMVRMTDDETLREFVKNNDDEITEDLFQIMSVMAQSAMAEGQRQVVERLSAIQEVLLEQSTVGKRLIGQQQTIESVVNDLRELGMQPDAEAMANLAASYAGDDDKVQAFVGLVGSSLEEDFFEHLSSHVEAASGDDRAALQDLTERIREYQQEVEADMAQTVQQIDSFIDTLLETDDIEQELQQNMDLISTDFISVLALKMQQAEAAQDEARMHKLTEIYARVLPVIQTQFLQLLVNTPDPEPVIRANIQLLDSNFMRLLALNAQEAQRQGNQAALQRFQELNQIVVPILQEGMPPEVRFINELLSINDDAALNARIQAEAQTFDENLVDVIDEISASLTQQDQQDLLARLQRVRQALAAAQT